MYANAAKQNGWWSEVELIIWGPSAKLTPENAEIRETFTKLIKAGVKTEAVKPVPIIMAYLRNWRSWELM
ncbi:MAG: hypothetical protein WC780_08400 [Lentimicrobiaceae bacterium]|jgi:hypothetical protein